MRMWMINPKLLCKSHLLGEHFEIHKHKHNFEKHHNITGRIIPVVQIEPEYMKVRHDELVDEMIRRGYNHKSPYEQPDLSYLTDKLRYAKVDIKVSKRELIDRCPNCKNNLIK